MHVLIIPSWYPENPRDTRGSFFREQALAVRRRGCKIGVIHVHLRSLRNWRSVFSGKYGIAYEDDDGVATYRWHSMAWYFRFTNPTAALWQHYGSTLFRKYVAEHGLPDVVHVHSMLYAGALACAIYKKYRIPYVITEHCSIFARGLVSRPGKKLAGDTAEHAVRRFAVSKGLAGYLADYLPICKSRWEVMPNLVNDTFFEVATKAKDHKEQFTFINVSNLVSIKGVDFLLQAFAKVCRLVPHVQLKIVGDGPERLRLERMCHDLEIAKRVQFLGALSRYQVRSQMADAAALVVSSRYETFGVVVIEALALGRPVIATRCGGPEDIIRKQDGLLVPVGDVDAFSSAMFNLYDQYDSYSSENIRAACKERYSEEVVVGKLMSTYGDVMMAFHS